MAVWLSSTGISPSRGSRATLPIACDASPPELRLHARAVAIRESHYPVGSYRPQAATPALRPCVSRSPLRGRGAPFARLVTNRSYPSALYCREFSASAFFVKELGCPRGKGNSRTASRALIQVKAQDGDNQFRFQASTQFFINIGTVIAVFVTARPLTKRSNVAGIMTDHLINRVRLTSDSGLDHRVRDHAVMLGSITHPLHLPSAFSAADRRSAGVC